ncbi:branched-chain amino acid ABC transporter permease [Paracraurococcus ruber]|uniref:Branched-chain amino acid ABC transporter permease n=1 Tax=Paracraurococcus ruber TaxID=77675 RepID=A0ABS1D5G1_9PROT|nr:branched-chain amino acid ABC transporter permease [Paracraurococcus ruber]MBK1662108.1 branched-chain amino acid ABC transporter permease [Paracraurococcus ruber]TDG23457.1 branched-chain amino acid ABC transporter permease [Paracraurococcus ruber]
MDAYLAAMLVFAGLYALMALGLNLAWGLAGMVNLGLAGFVAVGAYGSALLTVRLGWPMPLGIAAGTLLAAVAGAGLALLVARLRGDYLAIVTLGFAEVIRLIASNETWLTNGTDGISGIPGPLRGAVTPQQFNLVLLGLVWGSVGLVFLLSARLSHSPFGRVLRALREDEEVAAVAGKPVLAFRVRAFALGTAICGLAGALYAHYNGYVAPDGFAPLLTIYIVLALTAGGGGSMRGAVAGAVLVIVLLEGTRFLAGAIPGLAPVQHAALREASVALALLLLLRWRQQGLIPERTLTKAAP